MGRHVAQPERIENDHVIGPLDVVLGSDDHRRRLAFHPLGGLADHREVEPGYLHHERLVAGAFGRLGVFARKRVDEVTRLRIRMGIDDKNAASGHPGLRGYRGPAIADPHSGH